MTTLSTDDAAERSSSGLTKEVGRSGAVSFVGSAGGAVLGFTLTLVLATSLGQTGAGVALQAIAVFMIAMSLSRAGMDTGVVYQLPRLVRARPSEVRGAVVLALGAAIAAGVLTALVVCLGTFLMTEPGDLRSALLWSLWLLPAGAAMIVGLAALRALGDVWGYVAVGSLLVPLLRPVGVLLAVGIVGATGAAAPAMLAWALPFVVGLGLVLILLTRRLRALDPADGRSRFQPEPDVARELGGFAAARVLSTTLEQALLWLDVILVGALAGAAAAGVYGTASRFVAAGLIVDTALRIVVSPIFSRLMFEKRYPETERLYRDVTVWLVWFSTPVYVLLGLNAETILGWLGPGFESGATCLVILCIGTSVALCAGNIHSLLLMSGYSGWSLINKVVVLLVNVVGNLVAVPHWGIEGAASVWAAGMLLDAVMAAVEVRLLTGLRLDPRPVGRALLAVALSVGAVGGAVLWLVGPGPSGLVCCCVAAVGCWAAWSWVDRRTLNLAALVSLRR